MPDHDGNGTYDFWNALPTGLRGQVGSGHNVCGEFLRLPGVDINSQ